VPVPTAQKVRFGEFELDRQTAELFKHGTKLKLQGQPIAVLALLLERPGELVTREEIRKHLWPEDTFVDFEHSLNTHIKKLRQVFDDDAETPRYIETLPAGAIALSQRLRRHQMALLQLPMLQ
jgi:DNA-binding winged helix-turn-helix (wHTH) protein